MAAQVIVRGDSLLQHCNARLEAKMKFKLLNGTTPLLCAARLLRNQAREKIDCIAAHEMQQGRNILSGGRSQTKHSQGQAETAKQ